MVSGLYPSCKFWAVTGFRISVVRVLMYTGPNLFSECNEISCVFAFPKRSLCLMPTYNTNPLVTVAIALDR